MTFQIVFELGSKYSVQTFIQKTRNLRQRLSVNVVAKKFDLKVAL